MRIISTSQHAFLFLEMSTTHWHSSLSGCSKAPVLSVFPTNPFLAAEACFFKNKEVTEEAKWLNKKCLYTYHPTL